MGRLQGVTMNTTFEKGKGAEDWITPPEIVNSLGAFDLDPCVSEYQEEKYATTGYTIHDDGLAQPWFGRVWCNPPYGSKSAPFMERLAKHGNGIGLIFARMDTKLWHDTLFKTADAVFVFKGRIRFYQPTSEGLQQAGPAGAASCLVIYGKDNVEAVKNSGLKGKLLLL